MSTIDYFSICFGSDRWFGSDDKVDVGERCVCYEKEEDLDDEWSFGSSGGPGSIFVCQC